MRAWALNALTGVESMELKDLPAPEPAAGEVILGVDFAALNPADRYLAMGQYPGRPKFPHILGRDGAGKVLALGEGVTGITIGETRAVLRSEVGVSRWGTFAQRVAVEARYTVPIPAGWTIEQAAAAPLVYLTAWQALTQWGELSPQSVVLVSGASGGVGVATVQLASALGCTVIGLSRNAEKSEKLLRLGAQFVFHPEDRAWRKALRAELGERPVDLAVDNIGGDSFNDILETLTMWGKISVVGRLAGPVPGFNTASLFFRRIRIGGVAVGTYTNEEATQAWDNIIKALAKTFARPLIDQIFPFEEVKPAFERLERGPMGKVLLRVS